MKVPVTDDDDDKDFVNGILRDGGRYRVPFRMMDSMSKEIAKTVKHEHVTDALGNAELGLHRPGFRKLAGGNVGDALVRDGARAEAQRAYDDYETSMSAAYLGQQAGDVCTINGFPGHLDDDLRCVPDEDTDDGDNATYERGPRKGDSVEAAYDAYATEIQDAWRNK